MPLTKFESMLKSNSLFFFDTNEFEEIINHYLDIGKHSLAQKAIQLSLEQHPFSVSLKLLHTELLIFKNKISKAKKILDDIIFLEPQNEEVLIQKATILSKEDKHEEAIISLQECLKHTNDPSDIWSLIAMEYIYLEDYSNAKKNLKKCINYNIEDYSSLYNLIYCYEMEEEHTEAIDFLTKYIDRNPYSEIAWHQLGKEYLNTNKIEEAINAFEYAILIDDIFIGAYLEKAKALEKQKKYDQAIINYQKTLELEDPNAYTYFRIGECLKELHQNDGAIEYYDKAIHEDPLLDKAWIAITNQYIKENKYNSALHQIEKAIEMENSNPLYWRMYSVIQTKLNCFEKAIEGFKNCIVLGDTEIEIFINLSDIYIQKKEYEKALKTLLKARKTYKDFIEIEYRLTGVFILLNKKDYAITHLKKALKIDYASHIILEKLFPELKQNSILKEYLIKKNKAMDRF